MDFCSTFSPLRVLARSGLAALLGMMLFAAIPSGPALRLSAQESKPSKASEPSKPAESSQPAGAASHPVGETASQELEKVEDQEADPTENLKHSSAVRWIAHKTGLSVDQAYWLCFLLNFAIIFFGLAVPLWKRLPGLFKSRTRTIQSGIEEARKTSEEARRRLTEVEGRLSRLDVEITEMRRQAQENGAIEDQRILAETEEERRRIVASAEHEISLAAASARRDLRSYAAGLAVELAEKKIRVGKDADEALVREFTTQLGKDGN
jgi:F-type H+-transporting ATPase subunit b